MNNVYLHRLSNAQYHINEQLKEAKEALRNLLIEKGNLSDIDNVSDHCKYTANYIDDDGNAQSAYYRSVELLENRLYIVLSDEYCIFQEDISVPNIFDLITIIEDGHGTYAKQKTKPDSTKHITSVFPQRIQWFMDTI